MWLPFKAICPFDMSSSETNYLQMFISVYFYTSLKVDPYISADILLQLFQHIWQKETFPKEWKEGIIIKVPKKGDLSQCRNWWGITLLAVISKIFNKIMLEWIKNSFEMGLRKEQAGFCHNRTCIDQISTLRVIIE
jgi:hypothetical protein